MTAKAGRETSQHLCEEPLVKRAEESFPLHRVEKHPVLHVFVEAADVQREDHRVTLHLFLEMFVQGEHVRQIGFQQAYGSRCGRHVTEQSASIPASPLVGKGSV
ncbi:hypothetical protein D3875_01395 [Deinococcus cavernae]|uniref:Uncharacterized protein n=1 Tax=Deinococcus cavernae TaxID=2320857 RepID=A0A418VHE1_9DEIO|nr:hypothetical protein D3875_01395 [Deinococcus cavernae]